MGLKTLPPGLAQKLIEHIEDELTPLAEQHNRRIKVTPCLRCKGNLHPHLDSQRAFTPHNPLPRVMGKCVDCGLLWDPETNLILDTGDPRKVEPSLPLIRPRDD